MIQTVSLSLRDVSIRFRNTGALVLDRVNLEVGQNDFVALLGPSGCGKSTLLRIIAGLLEPTSGIVEVVGTSPGAAREQRRIGFVFQDAALMPWRSVINNVRLPLEVGPEASRLNVGMSPEEALELVGLQDFHHHLPEQLSGGMQQRVSIARALVTAPDVLLMDEPFGALDEMTRERLNDELLDLWSRTELTVVFVTHSIAEAAYLAQRVAVLGTQPGRIADVINVDAPMPRPRRYRNSPELAEHSARLREAMELA